MDVTDPWGTNWHHTSPYDIGMPSGAANQDNSDVRLPLSQSLRFLSYSTELS
ncbi:hypothetical protein P691DRAFT_801238, partial [Macrolepiota fuliginosa MF-IS2]